MMSEIYSLSITQLLVLLKGAGYNKINGFDLSDESLNDENVIRSLHALAKSGILTAENGEFEMIPEIKEAVLRVGSADSFYTIRSRDNRLPDRCVFVGEKPLVCSLRPTDKSRLTLCFEDSAELFEELSDEGYLPSGRSEGLFNEEDLIEYEQGLFSGISPDKALDISSCVVLSLDKLSENKETTPYLRIIDYYFYNYILYFDGKQTIREPYGDKSFKSYFERMLTV